MTRTRFLLTVCLLWLCCQLPIHPARATTNCAYNFTTGSGNTYLNYCVTVNGNIAIRKLNAQLLEQLRQQQNMEWKRLEGPGTEKEQ